MGAVGVVAAAATGASARTTRATSATRRIRVRLSAKRPEFVTDEVEGRDEDDGDGLGGDLAEPERHEQPQADEVRAERDERDDEEAESLVGEVPALAAERPD